MKTEGSRLHSWQIYRTFKMSDIGNYHRRLKTVPEAIIAFLDSDSYEDAVRYTISLGGDSDTLACITGGIAEAYYGPVAFLWKNKRRVLAERITVMPGGREKSAFA